MSEKNGNVLDRDALQQEFDCERVAKTMDTAVRNMCLREDDFEGAFPNLDRTCRQTLSIPEEILFVVARRGLQRVDGFRRQWHPDWCPGLLCIEEELVA